MNGDAETEGSQIAPRGEIERQPTVWLVIPCFNDSQRLAQFLPTLCPELAVVPLRVVVQVVDDGSSPEEQANLEVMIQETRSRFPFVRPAIFQGRNQGKGGAVLCGWEAGEGTADWLGFLDADGAIPADEVARILRLLKNQPEVSLFASRVRMRGRIVERSLKRHLMGRVFASLVGLLIDPGVYDTQCGFKLIPKEAYQKVKPFLQEKRFAFDVELLALLNNFQCRLEEVPINWFDVPGSKVSFLRDSIQMFRAVQSIRSRIRAGYESSETNRRKSR